MPSEVDLFLEFMIREWIIVRGEPVAEAAIAEFENRYRVKIPADIREFFLKINGAFVHGGSIAVEAMNRWCLLTEHLEKSDLSIPSESQLPGNCFRFGNYDILAWDWIIVLSHDLEAPTPVFVWHGDVIKIADDFGDFLHKFRIHGAEALLGYD